MATISVLNGTQVTFSMVQSIEKMSMFNILPGTEPGQVVFMSFLYTVVPFSPHLWMLLLYGFRRIP